MFSANCLAVCPALLMASAIISGHFGLQLLKLGGLADCITGVEDEAREICP